ncbi:MAG: glycosyltransferase family 39 protein [Gemmatimonadaceae bacterium]
MAPRFDDLPNLRGMACLAVVHASHPPFRMQQYPDHSDLFDTRAAAGVAIFVLLIHIIANIITPYELHRDEFLYLAMGEHLRLWRMDFPPFIAIVGRISHALFNASIPGLRLAPAISHAALVYCAAWATAAFGARRSAQTLTALAVATSPFFLRPGALFQPVTFDQLWWTLTLVALIMRIRDDNPKHWIGMGVFLGLGALTKFSIAFLAVGIILAVILTPLRRDILTRWPWLALAIAIIIGHPSITGQIALGWPVRQQMADLQSSQLTHVSYLQFLTGQLHGGPISIFAIFGMFFLMRSHANAGKEIIARAQPVINAKSTNGNFNAVACDWRPIAISTITPFVLLLIMRGKAYYIGPIYPILMAAGAAALNQYSHKLSPQRPTKVLAVAAAAVALFGMLTIPYGLPVLAPPDMQSFERAFGGKTGTTTNTGEEIALPQDYADMLGWTRLTETVARVWRTLPPTDTANAIIIATNYGRAGAIDLLGRSRGLPHAISPVGSYWFFGPGDKTGSTAVVVGDNPERLHRFYSEVTEVARTNNPWGVPEEQAVPIYVCRGAKRSIAEVWPSFAGQN